MTSYDSIIPCKNKQDFTINFFKLLLILGVVSIHSNVLVEIDKPVDNAGYMVVDFLASKLTFICVPCFFILSGYLFFNNITRFNMQVYKKKLRSRFYSLLLPYFLWNLIALALTIVKVLFFNYPSHGLIENGHLSLLKLFEGFVDYTDGYPYAFAFWFIRNLIVFVITSPIVALVIRKRWGIILLIPLLLLDINLRGFEYFIMGGWFAAYYKELKVDGVSAVSSIAIWIGVAVLSEFIELDYWLAVKFVAVICAFLGLLNLIRTHRYRLDNIYSRTLIASTFFIYAFHQLYCTVIRKSFENLFGLESSSGIILSYILSFLVLVGISFTLWLICRRLFPTATRLLGGNR